MECECIAGPVSILARNQVSNLVDVACLCIGAIHSTAMIILTDNIAFAEQCIPENYHWNTCTVSSLDQPVATLADELFKSDSIMQTEISADEHWDYLFAAGRARQSQFDALSRLATSGRELPDRTICCAGSGDEFHGFKGRGWQACEGNIHLSAFVKPGQIIEGAAVGFIIAGVIAALQTAGSFDLQGASPAIKWVNDILLKDAKVGGVLARLQTQGKVIESVVVGIGLNVEQKPTVKRDIFVPGVAALADFARHPEDCCHREAFPRLLGCLGQTLEQMRRGQFTELLDIYRENSLIMGRHVSIFADTKETTYECLEQGVVESIGPSLELYLKGRQAPITKGRLRLDKLA